jgi:hypothetical protein
MTQGLLKEYHSIDTIRKHSRLPLFLAEGLPFSRENNDPEGDYGIIGEGSGSNLLTLFESGEDIRHPWRYYRMKEEFSLWESLDIKANTIAQFTLTTAAC